MWDLLTLIWNCISKGGDLKDVLDLLIGEQMDIFSLSESALEQFSSILMEVNNNTRMLMHRGHTPSEMLGDRY